jgi:hypothetical protein
MKRTKPPAEARTIDMFSGRTKAEEQVPPSVSEEDTMEHRDSGEPTIEEACDRYRAQAFIGQEWTSKFFPNSNTGGGLQTEGVPAQVSDQTDTACQGTASDAKERFRLSCKAGWLYLEQLRSTPQGKAYHYAGVMFPENSLEELTHLFVRCARDRRTAKSATT